MDTGQKGINTPTGPPSVPSDCSRATLTPHPPRSVMPSALTPQSVKQPRALLSRQLADTSSKLTRQPGRALTTPPLRNQLPRRLTRHRIDHTNNSNERTAQNRPEPQDLPHTGRMVEIFSR